MPRSLLILSILTVSSKNICWGIQTAEFFRGKIIFKLFLLTFPLFRLNILILPAESAKTDAKRVRKQRGTTGKQDILLLQNKSTDNTAVIFCFGSRERRTFLQWMRARIYRIKPWLNLSTNKRSIIYILSTNIRIFGFITWYDFVLHSDDETKNTKHDGSVLRVYFCTSVLIKCVMEILSLIASCINILYIRFLISFYYNTKQWTNAVAVRP